MADITLVTNRLFKAIDRTYSSKYTIPTINANSTSAILGVVTPKSEGIIDTIRINCASEDYSVAIFTNSNGVDGSIDEVFKAIEIDKEIHQKVDTPFYNTDTTEISKLYIKVVNSDLVNATGVISVEIIYKTTWME